MLEIMCREGGWEEERAGGHEYDGLEAIPSGIRRKQRRILHTRPSILNAIGAIKGKT